ncbi:DUF3016 domain-containing protein [Pseudomonas sp. 2FG]|uniref:DUF3016 domain-containing protein n=1 Tax=Pseudomonas sp. 2FG TaxID=2502191 RepID=UPI0010F5D156|nr:DUF3016 domain-containing protein [Pseudomonas sp. 2FG]
MRLFIALILGVLLLVLAPVALASTTEVSFSHPENYSDARFSRAYGRGADDSVLNELQSFIEKLGQRYLQPGQSLRVQVLDIDLAGRYEPWRINYGEVRFMREITWPRIKLHYALQQDGQEIANREALVIDQSYLQHGNRYFSSDRLRYEKAMLDDWFRRNLGPQAQTQN